MFASCIVKVISPLTGFFHFQQLLLDFFSSMPADYSKV
jgi:hypothetical protein